MLTRVVVEVLLRTGLLVGEFTALRTDAVVLIGAAHWLHVPVGKLHEDRYLPLHPHLATLIGDYSGDAVLDRKANTAHFSAISRTWMGSALDTPAILRRPETHVYRHDRRSLWRRHS